MIRTPLAIPPLLMAFFVLVSACADGVGDTPSSAVTPPNVVIILADDLGYGDIGAYGAGLIRTPNLDQLANNGLRFTQAYASANVCSPSRAGLMTGRYPIRSGLAWKVVGANDDHGLPESEETIGELAQRAGYRTQYVGKWHLGRFPEFLPLYHGFDEFYGVPHSNDMPEFALFEGEQKIEEPVDQATLTRCYTIEATKFISTHAGSDPFLVVVSHTAPHIPLYASKQFQGQSAAGIYGDVVEELDWSTGQIVDALRNTGQLDNTLVIVTSDNGPFFEGGSGGLKGAKGSTWEGGYKVPFIVHWPATIARAGEISTITMNIDVFPTIAAAVRIEPMAEKIDGVSLMPVLRGEPSAANRFFYYFNNERVVGVRSQDWKYLSHSYYRSSLGAFEEFQQLPGFAGPYELLFPANDPEAEAYSYADRNPEIVRNHRRQLDSARDEFQPLRTRALEETFPISTREDAE